MSEDVVQKHRGGIDVVHGHVKEALNLVGVQIHREDAVHAHALEHVRHDLGGNGHAGGTRTAVLTGITVVGHHGGDAARGGAAQSVRHDHEFHQIIVGGGAGALQHEDVAAADVFVDFHHHFPVGEAVDRRTAERNVEVLRYRVRKLGVGVARENLQAVRNDRNHGNLLLSV